MCCRFNKFDDVFADTGEEIYNNIENCINSYNMRGIIERGVAVGFSGGADSVMLLLFLLEYRRRNNLNFPIFCVHVDHMIRGEEAERDMRFAFDFAGSLGVECVCERVDVPALSSQYGIGLEEAARNARYDIFRQILSGRNDAYAIALAHNAGDNTETVIFNMMRGAGLSGACGIPPVRDNIIRPMLRLAKRDIVKRLNECRVPFVYDSTNDDTEYTRNYIRSVIVPALRRLNPDPESAISRLTASLIEDNDYIESTALNIYDKIWDNNTADVSALRTLHSAVFARVISLAAQRCASVKLDSKKIKAIRSLIVGDNFSYSVGKAVSFVCQRGICRFVFDADIGFDSSVFELADGENLLTPYDAVALIGENMYNSSLNVYKFSIQASIPSAIINGKLRFRFKRDGDAYRYGGLNHKLKKVFNDRNIPPIERGRIPILCDDSGIIWVPGLPIRDIGDSSVSEERTLVTLYYNCDDSIRGICTAEIRK